MRIKRPIITRNYAGISGTLTGIKAGTGTSRMPVIGFNALPNPMGKFELCSRNVIGSFLGYLNFRSYTSSVEMRRLGFGGSRLFTSRYYLGIHLERLRKYTRQKSQANRYPTEIRIGNFPKINLECYR